MNPFVDPLKPATRDELVSMVVQYCGPDVSRGEISTMGFIRSQGHRATRQNLRDVIEVVDPIGLVMRRTVNLYRRVYSVKGPHHLWRVDGWHKLIRYGGHTRLFFFLMRR